MSIRQTVFLILVSCGMTLLGHYVLKNIDSLSESRARMYGTGILGVASANRRLARIVFVGLGALLKYGTSLGAIATIIKYGVNGW